MKPLSLKKIDTEEGVIYLPKELVEKYPSIHYLSFGTATAECIVKASKEKKDAIIISEDIFAKLKIPHTGPTQLIQHEDTLYIGPLIGVFTAGFTDSKHRPIGERSMFFSKILTVEKTVGAFPFVFGAHQINWENGTINGLFYLKEGWKKIEVPFPNVIYDRLPNRKTENHQAIKRVKQKLHEEYLIPWFNPGFFNKWEIHQLLENEPIVSHLLPETFENPSFSLIERLLSKYQHVYLKPANGSLGFGVYQIIYSQEEEVYYCRFKNEIGENKLQKFSSLELLINHLFKKKRFQDYIVQQGVSLIRINHRTIDFRVHTNKNRNGHWQVSVMAGKIAGRGSVTTHLNNGGFVQTLDEIFESQQEYNEITVKLEDAALQLSKAIDEKVKGCIGEIGFDLGIDKQGKVWLFEANSKPGRSIFSHPKLKKNDLLTRRLALQYAVHLAEKTIKSPEVVNYEGLL